MDEARAAVDALASQVQEDLNVVYRRRDGSAIESITAMSLKYKGLARSTGAMVELPRGGS